LILVAAAIVANVAHLEVVDAYSTYFPYCGDEHVRPESTF
jgi:hypothetical protein